MKPRLFIGSSKEGLKYVDYLVEKLADYADCTRWYDDHVFMPNKGTLDVLVKQAKLSDFALLVATKDDLTKSETREGSRITARDNVIFEHGLFLGATSTERAFLFAQEGIDLPSDFNGTSILTFSEEEGKYNYIDKVIDRLIKLIESANKQSELGFLPSTALAIGYYTGFINPVCEGIGTHQKVSYKKTDTPISTYKVKIILPADIDERGVNAFASKYNQVHKLEQASTIIISGSNSRDYPFRFKIDPLPIETDSPLDVHVYDIPTTLNTIVEAIKIYYPATYIGPNEDREYLEKRELRNFANVLRYYISKNVWARDHVEVIEGVVV